MLRNNPFPTLFLAAAIFSLGCRLAGASAMPLEDAWKALPKYEYGQDMAALLAMDRAVIQAMASPETRSACAERLASLLTSHEATSAACQYICLQLRQVGTPAEVPGLAELLGQRETSQMARYALESIPGRESMAALRSALTILEGKLLVGVINSVAARKDTAAVPILQGLADSQDRQVAAAALQALGSIADERATATVMARAQQAPLPVPRELAVALLRCADALKDAGKVDQAKTIYTSLGWPGQPAGVRRAALDGLLSLQGERATETIPAWLSDPDPDRARTAMGRLHTLSDDQLDQLLSNMSALPAAGQLAVIELGVARRGREILRRAHGLVQSDLPELKLAGIRCLGLVRDTSAIPVLIETLTDGGDLTSAAEDALANLPPEEVVPALLDALGNCPEVRVPVIRALVKLKSRAAIEALIEIASRPTPDQYGPALEGLRGIADPNRTDIARLVKLLLKTERGKHRDEVEKTILIVCGKLPAGAGRSQPVLEILAGLDPAESPKVLPLLGRLGGPEGLKKIQASLAGEGAAVREAAIRALCNWPNADVADRLLHLARTSDHPAHRRWALRAYIRVITLHSDRPEAKTLVMLQEAMQLSEGVDEKRLALERAATVRTMDTVEWIAPYLDDPELAQSACRAMVELAHHRFLRHSNMDRFGPILEKAGRISKDPAVAERANRYRLGL